MSSFFKNTFGSSNERSKKRDVYLFDCEEGDTSKKFVRQLNKMFKDDITFLPVSSSADAKNELFLVTVVRSVTERFEDDLDYALGSTKEKGLLHPKAIIYFHKDGCFDCSMTERASKRNVKYEDIEGIIDMDFSDESLYKKFFLHSRKKEVNRRARDRLTAMFKNSQHVLNNEKQLVYLYDSCNTEHSHQFIMELNLMMEETFEIESITDDTNQIPDAVICDANEFHHKKHDFKGSELSNPVCFVLHKRNITCDIKRSCVIDVPLPDDKSLIRVNYEKCKQFKKIVKGRKAICSGSETRQQANQQTLVRSPDVTDTPIVHHF